MSSDIDEVDLEGLVDEATRRGLDYVDARYQFHIYELIVIDNGVVREYSVNRSRGVGIRVILDGFEGFASTNDLSRKGLFQALAEAIKIAKAMRVLGKKVEIFERKASRAKTGSSYKIDPIDIDPSEKLKLLMDMHKVSRGVKGVSSSISRLGIEKDVRWIVSSRGDNVVVETVLVGVSQYSIAMHAGVMERVYDSRSRVAGWEYIKSLDLSSFAENTSVLALKAAQAKTLKPGVYDAVLDNEMVGLLLHEAFGHATEGDIVESGGSVLKGRVGERVASELVTIVDDGLVDGGYYVPFDDEGTPKKRVATVEKGVLKTFLQSLSTARKLGMKPTGNARAMDCSSPVIVRQTNTFMLPGDYSVEELISEIKEGVYISGVGALGGQVDTAMGTFTFTAGPSYIIRDGEKKELVRGVMLSGSILDTLKNIDAVARDLRIHTSVFGGCGKDGQLVRVGDGGPHVRVRGITIGGG